MSKPESPEERGERELIEWTIGVCEVYARALPKLAAATDKFAEAARQLNAVLPLQEADP